MKIITEKVTTNLKEDIGVREEIKSSDGTRYRVQSNKDGSTLFISRIAPYDLQEYHYAYSGPDEYTWIVARLEGSRPKYKGTIKNTDSWVGVANQLHQYDIDAKLERQIDRT